MEKTWEDLEFWKSDDWYVLQDRLKYQRSDGVVICPKQEDLFAALDATPLKEVRVAIFGQDPYPDPKLATGIAFSVPAWTTEFPPTLVNIFREYEHDLGLPFPETGSLVQWCEQGVLLWNVIPTCQAFVSLSHERWTEWKSLTKEIVEELSSAGVLMVFLGGRARDYVQYVDFTSSDILCFSHPSPRGSANSKTPFLGSKMFSTINERLRGEGLEPINWRLDDDNSDDQKL